MTSSRLTPRQRAPERAPALLPVPGFLGYYADDQGRVYSERHKHGPLKHPRELNQVRMPNGYLMIRTCIEGHVRFMGAHRAVALAFHGEPQGDKQEVRHLDGSRDNNVPSNLAWGTKVENAGDRLVHGTMLLGEKNSQAKLTADTVREIRRRYRTEVGVTHLQLASEYGVSEPAIAAVISKRNWKHVD